MKLSVKLFTRSLVISVLLLGKAHSADAQRYVMTPFAPPVTGDAQKERFTPLGLNNLGQVVGVADIYRPSDQPRITPGFLWENGQYTALDIGSLDPADTGIYVPRSINDNGEIAGVYGNATARYGVHWQNGTVQTLGNVSLMGSPAQVDVLKINNRGEILGQAGVNANGFAVNRGVVWRNGQPEILEPLSDPQIRFENTSVIDINNRGKVLMTSYISPSPEYPTGVSVSYTVQGSKIHRIDTQGISFTLLNDHDSLAGVRPNAAPPYMVNLQTVLVNGNQQVVIDALGEYLAGPTAPYRMRLIQPRGLNNRDQIVGFSSIEPLTYSGLFDIKQAAFLWDNGQLYNLNSLVAPNPDWYLTSAHAINEQGQILVDASHKNPRQRERLSFLLTPVPEPNAVLLAVSAPIAGFWVMRRRRREKPFVRYSSAEKFAVALLQIFRYTLNATRGVESRDSRSRRLTNRVRGGTQQHSD